MHAFNSPYFNFCWIPDSKTEPNCTFNHNKQTCDFNHAHSLTSTQLISFLSWHAPVKEPNSLPCQKWTSFNVKVVFSKPIYAAGARIDPPGANQGLFTSNPTQHPVGEPTHLCPTLPVDAEPAHQRIETIVSMHCAVWCNQSVLRV